MNLADVVTNSRQSFVFMMKLDLKTIIAVSALSFLSLAQSDSATFGSYYVDDTDTCAGQYGPSFTYSVKDGYLDSLSFPCSADNKVYSFGVPSANSMLYRGALYSMSIIEDSAGIKMIQDGSSVAGSLDVKQIKGVGAIIQKLRDESTRIVGLVILTHTDNGAVTRTYGRKIDVKLIDCGNTAIVTGIDFFGPSITAMKVTCSDGGVAISPDNYGGSYTKSAQSSNGFKAISVAIQADENGGTIYDLIPVPMQGSPNTPANYKVSVGTGPMYKIIALMENGKYIMMAVMYRSTVASQQPTVPPSIPAAVAPGIPAAVAPGIPPAVASNLRVGASINPSAQTFTVDGKTYTGDQINGMEAYDIIALLEKMTPDQRTQWQEQADKMKVMIVFSIKKCSVQTISSGSLNNRSDLPENVRVELDAKPEDVIAACLSLLSPQQVIVWQQKADQTKAANVASNFKNYYGLNLADYVQLQGFPGPTFQTGGPTLQVPANNGNLPLAGPVAPQLSQIVPAGASGPGVPAASSPRLVPAALNTSPSNVSAAASVQASGQMAPPVTVA
jgi:hypothetical protein